MSLSGIGEINDTNSNMFGVSGQAVITYLDCLFVYAQNHKLNSLGFNRVSLIQPLNTTIMKAKDELIFGFTNEKALYFSKEINVINSQTINAEAAEEIIGINMFVSRGYKPQFFIRVPLNIIEKDEKLLLSMIDKESTDKLSMFGDLMENQPDVKTNVLEMTDKLLSHFSKVVNRMQINPIFRAKDLTVNQTQVFYALHFDSVRTGIFDIVKKCLEDKFNLTVIKSGDLFNPEVPDIMENIWISINTAKFVIVDISDKNPNVFYELGLCHTLGKPTMIICDRESLQNDYEGTLPFDVGKQATVFYKNDISGADDLKHQVAARAESFITGNPVML